MSFAFSAAIHGGILAWLAFSPAPALEPRLSLYDQVIKPHEKRIVWYNLRDRLPDVTPAAVRHDPRPPRALRKFNQSLVAGARDTNTAPQMIFMPAPEIQTAKPLPLPNVVAVAPPPKLRRTFAPPPERPPLAKPPVLPDPPPVASPVKPAAPPIATRTARPLRAFIPPPEARIRIAPAPLPDAPPVASPIKPAAPPIATRTNRPLRAFSPPPEARTRIAPASLPEAPGVVPEVAVANQARSLPLAVPDPRAPLRKFAGPPAARQPPTAASPELPAAPSVASTGPSQATLAIVGLNPAKAPDFPTPPGSRSAGFSAGPKPEPKGSDTDASDVSIIVVPGLLARGGAHDAQPTLAAVNPNPMARENLMAAARNALASPAKVPAEPNAARVSSAPDPRLEGRAVYSIAIQMPNITSYSGSWIVWFAERQPLSGAPPADVRAPVPLRKVDPKYIPAAVQERVEGTVRLFAVIRKDGRVESVSLLKHLDDRLDLSAEDALAKWIFEPALRNGSPMEVEAVFEIPFRLAPRAAR